MEVSIKPSRVMTSSRHASSTLTSSRRPRRYAVRRVRSIPLRRIECGTLERIPTLVVRPVTATVDDHHPPSALRDGGILRGTGAQRWHRSGVSLLLSPISLKPTPRLYLSTGISATLYESGRLDRHRAAGRSSGIVVPKNLHKQQGYRRIFQGELSDPQRWEEGSPQRVRLRVSHRLPSGWERGLQGVATPAGRLAKWPESHVSAAVETRTSWLFGLPREELLLRLSGCVIL
ncbi:hypothetical protein UPYG_G00176520 [Umbra pygmaea]|uniref:Uncharacterized protein n=1 Tax=Umbra pygmaea TaxID=75934 RepID=A0ABD0WUP0_UMBPY